MIHFFPTFSRTAADGPFGQALRELGIAHRIFAGTVRKNYKSRLRLFLVCIPNLAWFAVRSAIASVLLAKPRPQAVVLGSDVEVLIFALARILFLRRHVRIVLGTFIYTRRRSRLMNGVRHAYFAWMLRSVDLVVVHSRLEAETYPLIFPRVHARFVFIPWGTSVPLRNALLGDPDKFSNPSNPPYVVSAGKSGRDYATLFAAISGQGVELRVICDYAHALGKVPTPDRVTVLSRCYGDDYVIELFGAAVVVVPLAVDDISAGQMVLIQAMSLGKPIVVTRTSTICDYVTDGEDALLVERGDPVALRAAIQMLLKDPALRARLGQNAIARFDRNYSTKGHLRMIVEATQAVG
jgi:glycosyltransferase involved in cell wall biosynthesis